MAALQDDISDIRFICQSAKLLLSTISASLIAAHLIGDCQYFVFVWNSYIFITSCLWFINLYKFESKLIHNLLASNMLIMLSENIVALASFTCIAANAEDQKGLSKLEIVTICGGMLWGINLTTITITYLEDRQRSSPYHVYDELDELDF